MKLLGARRAWHDAFRDDVESIDYRDLVGSYGVQFTARGADNKIMDHVEKGLIQQVIQKIKDKDKIAWAWGCVAYAPLGVAHGFDRSTLLTYMWHEFERQTGKKLEEPRLALILRLARIAYEDAAHEDRSGKRKCRRYRDMAKVIGITEKEYKETWLRDFIKLKIICKDLPERALTPVADFIWSYLEIADPETSEFMRRSELESMHGLLGVSN